MDLLNNYLAAIGKHLPEGQREDILQELSANLTAEIDDTEASLGRPLTKDELAAVIRKHGHPMAVAAQYAPQRYLIGPSLFPIYRYVLVRAMALGCLIYAIASAATVAAGHGRAGEALLRLPGAAFGIAAWVTLVFAAGEFFAGKFHVDVGKLHKWDPRELPKAVSPRSPHRVKAVCALVASLLFTAWLAAIPYYPFLLLGPGAAYLASIPIKAAPIWGMLYWPVVMFFLARSAVDFASAMRPSTRRQREWAELVIHGFSVAVVAVFLQSGEYFTLIADRPDPGKSQDLAAALNQGVLIGAAVTLVISIAQIVLAARQLISNSRARRFAPPSVSL